MSSFRKCKSYSHFFSKNISVYAIFNDQSFNDTLTNDIVSFEQLGRLESTNLILFKKFSTKQQVVKWTCSNIRISMVGGSGVSILRLNMVRFNLI